MKKYFFLLFILCLIPLLFCSCHESNSSALNPFSRSFQADMTLVVGDYETRGTLDFETPNRITFTHTERASPLFGMQEKYENGRISVHFMGIVWEAEEVFPAGARLLKFFLEGNLKNPTRIDEIDGRKEYLYEWEDANLTIEYSKDQTIPKKLRGSFEKIPFSATITPKEEIG